MAAAGALYLVFRSHERSLALFSLVALLAAGVAFAVATASFFGLSFLAQDFVDTSGAEASALAGTARAVGLAGFSAYFTALTLTGAGALPLGVLIVWSKAVPDWLGWPAVFSAILMLLSWLIFAPSVAGLIIAAIGGLGTLLFFLILGIWLLVRGTRDVRTV